MREGLNIERNLQNIVIRNRAYECDSVFVFKAQIANHRGSRRSSRRGVRRRRASQTPDLVVRVRVRKSRQRRDAVEIGGRVVSRVDHQTSTTPTSEVALRRGSAFSGGLSKVVRSRRPPVGFTTHGGAREKNVGRVRDASDTEVRAHVVLSPVSSSVRPQSRGRSFRFAFEPVRRALRLRTTYLGTAPRVTPDMLPSNFTGMKN